MWNGSKYSMAVQAEMLCLFPLSRSQPPVLSCDRIGSDFQQWESSVEQLMPSTLRVARLPSKVKEKKRKGKKKKKRREVVLIIPHLWLRWLCVFSELHTPPPSCFKDAALARCQHRTAAIFRHDFICTDPNSAASEARGALGAVHGSGKLDGHWQVQSLSEVLNIQSMAQG